MTRPPRQLLEQVCARLTPDNVPPDDETPPPPAGNFSNLGLGGSSSVEGPGAEGGNDLPIPPIGKGAAPEAWAW